MNRNKRKKIEILENATVVFNNGEKEILDAVNVNHKGVFTGHLRNHSEFVEGGGIPANNIKRIIGGKKRVVFANLD